MIHYTDEEMIEEREDSIELLVTRSDEPIEAIRERYLNDFGYHEVLHVSSIFMENVEQYLLEHACVILDETAYRLAHQAHTALFNLYQRLGNLRFSDSKDTEVEAEIETAKIEEPKQRQPWRYLFWHLDGSIDLPQPLKEHIRQTLNIFMDDEDDDDVDPPNSGSFIVMLTFLQEHPELPAPSLGIDPNGRFSACWRDDTHRWSLVFHPWQGLHNEKTPLGSVRQQQNIDATTVFNDGTQIKVDQIQSSINDIQIPEWLEEIK